MQSLQADPLFLSAGNQDRKHIVYQLFIRLFSNAKTTNHPWGTIEENGVGKFNDINRHVLQSLREFGVTHVWFTGVLEHATMTNYSEYGIHLDDPDVVKGRAGSPYAVKDYYDVDPDLAELVPDRMAEFEALVQRTHDAGLKVIIDFIPNHLARYYQSDQAPEEILDFGEDDDVTKAFHPQNNFYYLPNSELVLPEELKDNCPDHEPPLKDRNYFEKPAKATGNDVFHAYPSISDWYETIKLNYGINYRNGGQTHFEPIPDTWNKMYAVLAFWTKKGVDGFRCDMAEMVPIEFWEWVVPKIKALSPEMIFIAEIYNEHKYRDFIERGQFDYLYDKVQLYDTLKKIVRQKGSTDWLTGIWQYLRGINKNMLRFLENHDEQRIASPDFATDPWHALPAMVVSSTWQNGPVMVYFGQEVGEPGAGYSGFSREDGRTTIFDYWGVPLHQQWYNQGACDGQLLPENRQHLRTYYQELLQLCRKEDAIKLGHFYDLHPANKNSPGYSEKVLSYARFTKKELLIFIIHFGVEERPAFEFRIPESILNYLDLGSTVELKGIFGTTNTYIYKGKIHLEMPPLGSFILKATV